jgi:predicted DNA-binding antitoxin AbrB/MazE fold protein
MWTRLKTVYENGVFRPIVQAGGIPEHARVVLTVAVEQHSSSLRNVAGSISADDAEEMKSRRTRVRARRFS